MSAGTSKRWNSGGMGERMSSYDNNDDATMRRHTRRMAIRLVRQWTQTYGDDFVREVIEAAQREPEQMPLRDFQNGLAVVEGEKV